MKNTLVTIGYLGSARAYLNVSPKEAIERYRKSEDMLDNWEPGDYLNSFEFDDEFWTYEASSLD